MFLTDRVRLDMSSIRSGLREYNNSRGNLGISGLGMILNLLLKESLVGSLMK
jgi:hypothetical protein